MALETALYAASLGYPVRVLEQGRVGHHLHRWGHVRMFTPWSMNMSLLGRRRLREAGQAAPNSETCPLAAEFLDHYLLPLSRLPELQGSILENTRVLAAGKASLFKHTDPGGQDRSRVPFQVLVEAGGAQSLLPADILIDATGVFGQPAPLGPGGLPAPGETEAAAWITTGIPRIQPEAVNGKDLMVVGGGMSAATTLAALAAAEPRSVTWVTVQGGIPEVPGDPLPERLRLTRTANTFGDGDRVDHLSGYAVAGLETAGNHLRVRLQSLDGDTTVIKEVDRIFNHTGFRPDLSLLRELQIHLCYATEGTMNLAAALLGDAGADCLDQVSHGADTLRNPEPRCFVLGHKSYGRNPNFLLRIGHEQVRDVFRLITGDPALDLYAPLAAAP